MLGTLSGDVKCFPTRTANVEDRFLELPRNMLEQLEKHLAELAGVTPDNHTVYEIDQASGVTYLFFHDDWVFFGRLLVERPSSA